MISAFAKRKSDTCVQISLCLFWSKRLIEREWFRFFNCKRILMSLAVFQPLFWIETEEFVATKANTELRVNGYFK